LSEEKTSATESPLGLRQLLIALFYVSSPDDLHGKSGIAVPYSRHNSWGNVDAAKRRKILVMDQHAVTPSYA
jgi:hypothetical protein